MKVSQTTFRVDGMKAPRRGIRGLWDRLYSRATGAPLRMEERSVYVVIASAGDSVQSIHIGGEKAERVV